MDFKKKFKAQNSMEFFFNRPDWLMSSDKFNSIMG